MGAQQDGLSTVGEFMSRARSKIATRGSRMQLTSDKQGSSAELLAPRWPARQHLTC